MQPVSHGLLNVGQTAKMSDYLDEIHSERIVISISDKLYGSETNKPNSISLLTQLSSDRFELLDLLVKQWSGAMNVALYTRPQLLSATIEQVSHIPCYFRVTSTRH